MGTADGEANCYPLLFSDEVVQTKVDIRESSAHFHHSGAVAFRPVAQIQRIGGVVVKPVSGMGFFQNVVLLLVPGLFVEAPDHGLVCFA
jgi:hypothetical protein